MGSLGAAAALAARALGRPLRVKAADTSITYTNDENNGTVLSASSVANGPVTGHGIGVEGHSDDSVGVHGTSGSSVGVRGESETGRGGLFKGRKAQVRLQPSTANSHPASGAKGDLFVDRNGRLWFCKGGSTWRQLA